MGDDWAELCALDWIDRWHKSEGDSFDFQDAIEGAVREALEKAAEVAENANVAENDIGEIIRALGAKKP